MRLDDIKARAAAAQAPDEEWVTEIAVQSHHIDLMEHARTDIPDLLRVVEAAMALLAPPLSPSGLTSDMRCRMCYGRIVVLGNQIALDHDAGCSLSINLRAALAPLLADE